MEVLWEITHSSGPFELKATYYEDRSVKTMEAIRDLTGEALAKHLFEGFNLETHAARLMQETCMSTGNPLRALQIFEVAK